MVSGVGGVVQHDVMCSSGCGANFTAPSGRVVSPNYPSDYPDSARCNYTIDAGLQTVVVVTFQVFQVEGTSLSPQNQMLFTDCCHWEPAVSFVLCVV